MRNHQRNLLSTVIKKPNLLFRKLLFEMKEGYLAEETDERTGEREAAHRRGKPLGLESDFTRCTHNITLGHRVPLPEPQFPYM